MKSGIKNTVVILLLSIPFIGFAQLQLNLRNAIDTALRNNYDIRIAKIDIGLLFEQKGRILQDPCLFRIHAGTQDRFQLLYRTS